jgi:hypothetical protein
MYGMYFFVLGVFCTALCKNAVTGGFHSVTGK